MAEGSEVRAEGSELRAEGSELEAEACTAAGDHPLAFARISQPFLPIGITMHFPNECCSTS